MECGKIDIDDCVECDWMHWDVDDVCFCSLYDRPIGEIESCDPNRLSYSQELLIIEEQRGR